MQDSIYILGAGASGMMAAISAAKNGASVVLMEANKEAGKKILMTGNGRCNITNQIFSNQQYFSSRMKDLSSIDDTYTKDFLNQVFSQFAMEDTLSFFHELGILTKNIDGYYYPRNLQAKTIQTALYEECKRLGVRFLFDCKVKKIEKVMDTYRIEAIYGGKRTSYLTSKLIVACGGASYPNTGSDGYALNLLGKLGLPFYPFKPSLTAAKSMDGFLKALKGLRINGGVKLYLEDRLICEEEGQIQFLENEVSGIPVFQISHFLSVEDNYQKKAILRIDFFPELGEDDLWEILAGNAMKRPNQSMKQLLCGLIPDKAAKLFLNGIGLSEEMPSKEFFKDQNREKQLLLIALMKGLSIKVCGLRDFSGAQVSLGGVLLTEICPKTMECNSYPGLYVCGELVDIDGICGGYNLQWAWSSGYLAGISTANTCK